MTQLKRHGLFDTSAPRYTSYPPANRFSNAVSPSIHRDWLASVPAGARVSIYVHVPFCRRLCWFCACRTQGMRRDAPVTAYVETLLTEIKMLRQALPEDVQMARLHWGGGTPTLMSPRDMDRLARALHLAFPATPDVEFSVEIDPTEIDDARLDALALAGMNRASIGVQDFDPEVQSLIGREQSYQLTSDVVTALRARGVHSLNTDLLYGLPKQTNARIAASMQMLLSLNPDRLALYGYAHVPWMSKRQSLIPTEHLPAPEARLGLFETAQKLLHWDGYTQIGIDHFARPTDSLAKAAATGHLKRNFQGYTDDSCDVLIGLGASSISKFPQGYVQSLPGTAAYQKAVRGGVFPTGKSHIFEGDDRLRARLIEMIMCDFRIDIAQVEAEGLGKRTHVEALLAGVADTYGALVEFTPDALSVPQQSVPLARLIARSFDAYDTRSAGHSSAI